MHKVQHILGCSYSIVTLFYLASCSEETVDINAPEKVTENKKEGSSPYPYGVLVDGRDGYVYSPHDPLRNPLDVRGLPINTPVRDPYSNSLFLVPELPPIPGMRPQQVFQDGSIVPRSTEN